MALILELRLPSGKVNANDMAKRIFLLAGPAPSTPQDKDLLARLRGALTPTPPKDAKDSDEPQAKSPKTPVLGLFAWGSSEYGSMKT